MRAILGSYDSELSPAEYSPQLTRRVREAEDMVQKVHAHSSEMEVSVDSGLPWLGDRGEFVGLHTHTKDRRAPEGVAVSAAWRGPSVLLGKVTSSCSK